MMSVSTTAHRPDPVRLQPVEPQRRAMPETKPKAEEVEPKELDIDNLPCTD